MATVAEDAEHDPRFPKRRNPPPRPFDCLTKSRPDGAQSEGGNFDPLTPVPDEARAR